MTVQFKQVDQHTGTDTNTNRVIEVPSLASIEELRTPAFDDLISENRSKCFNNNNESKKIIQQQRELNVGASPNRTPFASVN